MIRASTPAWLETPSESRIILPGSPWWMVRSPEGRRYRQREPLPNLTALSCLASDAPPSVLPSPTYLEIFIYCLGFFIVVVLTATAVVCRLCCAPKKSDFSSQIAVQKLAKSIPLKRQVTARVGGWNFVASHKEMLAHTSVLCLQVSVESSSSLQSGACLIRQSRLPSAATTTILPGVSEYELPYDPVWELPRDR